MMRKNSSTVIIGIVGAIFMIFTLSAFFLLNIERIALYWWALAFLLLAELVLCTGLVCLTSLGARYDKAFVRSGITGALSLYFIAAIISVLTAGLFKDRLNTFILIQLGLLALLAIIILLILVFARRIADNSRKIVNDQRFMDVCEKRAYNLLADTKNKEYENNLNTLYENLKYSDKVGTSSVDEKIAAQLSILENSLNSSKESKDDLLHIFDEISTFLNQRKIEIGELKRGGF